MNHLAVNWREGEMESREREVGCEQHYVCFRLKLGQNIAAVLRLEQADLIHAETSTSFVSVNAILKYV